MRKFIPGLVPIAVLGLLLAAVSLEAETKKSDEPIKDQIHRFNVVGHDQTLSRVGAGYPSPQARPVDVDLKGAD